MLSPLPQSASAYARELSLSSNFMQRRFRFFNTSLLGITSLAQSKAERPLSSQVN